MMVFHFLRNMEQHFVVVLSYTGRVDPHPYMFEPLIFMEHCLDPPGIFKASKVIVHVEADAPDFRVAFQKCSQRHMGSAAQRQPVAVPFPAFQFLQRGMGEGINGCLKDRHMAAARIPRWIAES